MSRAAVFFGCCKASEESLLSLAGSGILASFNILQIGSAAPVFRIHPYTEGGKGFEESSSDIISFLFKKANSWLHNSTQAFLPHLQKYFFIDICSEMNLLYPSISLIGYV